MERTKSAARPSAWHRTLHWGWLVALALAVVIAAFAIPKAQPKAQPVGADFAAVVAADSALNEALRTADRGRARRLLSLQFSFVGADGKIRLRKVVLADLKSFAAAAAAGDATVRNYGRLALVMGHRKTVAGTNDEVSFFDVWVKQKGAWRALLIENVPAAATDPRAAAPPAPAGEVKQIVCKNPCQIIPYRVRSAAEQDIVNAYQAIAKAIVAHDANEWARHVADDFVLYGSARAPMAKSGRIATIERQKDSNTAATVGEVQTMRLSVYGDGAAMITTDTAPDDSHPPYRALRLWVKRNGQWLMAISAHTEVE
jgi:hypothetical protein